ncbi:hypothetical protein SAMN06273572_102420 [Monaibacterium marinum]|uniref:YfbU domain-containing protein n=1 Tax=Pontivivens marinum TaxID=1690039 RepID=A0A2C9CR73_9RHOB|nr:YfbU family protein [Monaibacterium marinum]SOH93742.1 hypothetical protein SAMN06273572_102420 [Monaibacterium marinum]
MELTKNERLSLIYQLRILEALYPEEATNFVHNRTALENGFTLHYDWIFENLRDELSKEECQELLDILDMYRAITFSLRELDEGDVLHEHHLAKFRGFDGNKEGQLMAYVRYFIVDLDRYDELKYEKLPSFNSHTSMLNTYREMLSRWSAAEKKHILSREQICTVLEG